MRQILITGISQLGKMKFASLIPALILFLGIGNLVQAQLPDDIGGLSAPKLKTFGEEALLAGDVYSAVSYLEAFNAKKKDDADAMYMYAEALRKSRNYKASEEWYENAYAKSDKKVKALFYQAKMEKMQGKYEEAAATFSTFKKKYKNQEDSKFMKGRANKEMQGCLFARKLIDTIPLPLKVKPLNKTINQPHIDFAPVLRSDSTLLFGSMREEANGFYEDDQLDRPRRKIYEAKFDGSDWQFKGELPGDFNDPAFDTGNTCYSIDGNTIYFTRCFINDKGNRICHIYKSERERERDPWSEPEALPAPVNLKNYSSSQPAVGMEFFRNREVLYFVSNRPDGKGGTDIYYTINDPKKGMYSAKNAGIRVNSVGDEMSPFYDLNSRTLYFSSDGRAGLGGLDVYKTTGEPRKFADTENAGYPINSPQDDLYFSIVGDEEHGFLVSNREGSIDYLHENCCDDIFVFEPIPEEERVKEEVVEVPVEEAEVYEVAGAIYEIDPLTSERNLGTGVLVTLYKKTDGKEEFVRSTMLKPDGTYSFELEEDQEYELVSSKDGFFTIRESFNTKDITESIVNKDLEITGISQEAIVIPNIYYEFDKSSLTADAERTIAGNLFKLLKDNPHLIVEISSHTDSKGSESYNNRLSQNRAESVVRYLKEIGIDGKRLRAKGYGEGQPIAANKNSDGSDNPEGREKNRRTEFRVVGVVDIDVEYSE